MINTGINTSESLYNDYIRERSSRIRHISLDNEDAIDKIYKFGPQLGEGQFGVVFEVTNNKNEKWAMKVVVKKRIKLVSKNLLDREISILKMLDHPHIIVLHEILESEKKLFLVVEKCATDLMKMLMDRGSAFPEKDVIVIIRDLSSALSYIHKKGIVHRDVKLENVLVRNNPDDINDNLYIKLTDFGLSIIKTVGNTFSDVQHDKCGTAYTMAPEIVTAGSFSQQCDVWAAGVIMYTLLTAKRPFSGSTDSEIMVKIVNIDLTFDSLNVHPNARFLLEKILDKNPMRRITAAEILASSWISGKETSSKNVLHMMRDWNNDLKVPQGKETDWLQEEPKAIVHKATPSTARNRHRDSVPMSVTALQFDKQNNTKDGKRGKRSHQK